jgi:filamentous hemagglutinin
VLLACAAQAQVVADPNAPAAQRPTVLVAPNGVPLVNIRTPSAAGVSRNTFSQFDVLSNGVILNNSRGNVQTQLGGWVQGNPWLATGGARVILNEVNSSNPSQLRGYLEVAGQRAEVIIANAAGISVDGGGFINASRVTLTTGAPRLGAGGALDGFDVQRGVIAIDGLGLDASSTDYTAILARAVSVNAGLWAKELRVVTGANTLDAEHGVTGSTSPAGAAPAFALDVSRLGGMYAGKITLVGTEAGLGVSNAGVIGASAGDVRITHEGLLVNAGQISASGAVDLRAGDITNSGNVYAGADTGLQATRIDNSGLVAAQGHTTLRASERLTSADSGVIAAGLAADGRLSAVGDITASAGQSLALHGQTLATRAIDAQGASVNLQRAQIDAQSIIVRATAGDLDAAQSTISAPTLELAASALLRTDGATVSAERLALRGAALSNVGGAVSATGAEATALSFAGSVDNRGGTLAGNGALTLRGQRIDNSEGGRLSALGTLTVVADEAIDNTHGVLVGREQTSVEASALTNTQGQLGSEQGHLGLATRAGTLDNRDGRITARSLLVNTSGQALNNAGGTIAATEGDAELITGQLINTGGARIEGAAAVSLITTGVNNQDGRVSAQGTLTVTANDSIDNTSGVLVGRGRTSLDAARLTNAQGELGSQQDHLAVTTRGAALDNAGGTMAARSLVVNTTGQALNNAGGTIAATEGSAELITGQLANTGSGRIESNGALDLTTTGIDNQGGRIQSLGAANLRAGAGTIDNRASSIAGASVTLAAALVDNRNTRQAPGAAPSLGIDGADVTVRADRLDNTNGALRADRDATLALRERLDNGNGVVSARRDLRIDDGSDATAGTGVVTNTAGTLQAVRQLGVRAASLGGDGDLLSQGNANVTVGSAFTHTGRLVADGNATLAVAGALNNSAEIKAGGTLTVNAGEIDNAAGGEISATTTRITATGGGALVNRGLIDGVVTRIEAGTLHNLGSGRIYGDWLSIKADDLINAPEGAAAPVIAARERLDIGALRIDNRLGGSILSLGDMAIGGTLGADDLASGRAERLTNHAALINAGGALAITATELRNTNQGFATRQDTTTGAETRRYIQIDGVLYAPEDIGACYQCSDRFDSGEASQRRLEVVAPSAAYPFAAGYSRVPYQLDEYVDDGSGNLTPVPLDRAADSPLWQLFSVPVGNQAALRSALAAYNADFMSRSRRDWRTIDITQATTTSTVVADAGRRGQITSGANLTLDLTTGTNDQSSIIAGGALTVRGTTLANPEVAGRQTVYETGTWRGDWVEYSPYRIDRGHYGSGAYGDITSDRTTTLNTAQALHNANPAAPGALGALQAAAANVAAPNAARPAQGNTATPDAGTAASATPAAGGARAATPNTTVSSSGLYRPAEAPNARFLVETDPRFTSHRQWLASDYLLRALDIDPAAITKRLGDGFYEQQLIREQVAQLTGQRFLGEHSNDEAQYRALLDAAATEAKAHTLVPGIALSEAQMAQLTSDIVWLVEQDVVLADGSKTRALVPQLYVRPREGDVTGAGSLIAGRTIDIQITGDLANGGAIAGRRLVSITADNITNAGGRIGANTVVLDAKTDLNNLGGTITAGNTLSLAAGRDVLLQSTTVEATWQQGSSSASRTGIGRVAGVYVTGNGTPSGNAELDGLLAISAGRNLNANAAAIANGSAGGATVLQAKNDLALGTVAEQQQQRLGVGQANNASSRSAVETGTRLQANGAVVLSAGNDLSTRAANVDAQGALSVQAGNDIHITAGQQSASYEDTRHSTTRQLLGSASSTHRDSNASTTAIASELGGQTVSLAGRDITIHGSNVIGNTGVLLDAKRDVAITAATNTQSSTSNDQSSKAGLMGASGGIGITVGAQSQSTDVKSSSTSAAASTVGAIDGNVVIVAGGNYRQVGSDVMALAGDKGIASDSAGNLAIQAQRIDIVEARETSNSATETKFQQAGITLAISSPVLSAVQTAVAQVDAADKTGSSRMQMLAGANAAMNLRNAGNALQAGQGEGADAASAAGGVSVSLSIGGSKSQSNTTSASDSARGSSLNAAGNITLRATGAGQDSDLTLQGVSVQAGGTVALKADDAINLLAASNTTTDSNSNKSTSGSIGVGFGVGNGSAGAGVTVSASVARGHGNGQSTTWSNTRIDAANVTIDSGGDATLKGAVVSANTIKADIGGNLRIESLQDSASYTEKQTSAGASVTVGAGASGSANFSQSRINSVYASVTEQSGLKAGDGGFQVTVRGNTSLVGGAITSTQAAIDNNANTFSTAQLTTSDIDNKASYSARSISVSGGSGGGSAGFSNESANSSSTTRAAISGVAGSQSARTGDKDSGLANTFDRDAVRAEMQANTAITQEFGRQAPKAVADFARSQINNLEAQIAEATANRDTSRVAELDAERAKWVEGGVYRVAMHTGIGALSGGFEGAIGAGAAAQAAPLIDTLQISVQTRLQNAGMSPDAAKAVAVAVGTGTATVIGAAASGGTAASAATAFNADANNRQSRTAEQMLIEQAGKGLTAAQRQVLEDASCALTKCAAGIDPDSPRYSAAVASQARGGDASLAPVRAALASSGMFDYTNADLAGDLLNRAVEPLALRGVAALGDVIDTLRNTTITVARNGPTHPDLPPDLGGGNPPSASGGVMAVAPVPMCVPPVCVAVPAPVGTAGQLPVNVVISSNAQGGGGGSAGSDDGANASGSEGPRPTTPQAGSSTPPANSGSPRTSEGAANAATAPKLADDLRQAELNPPAGSPTYRGGSGLEVRLGSDVRQGPDELIHPYRQGPQGQPIAQGLSVNIDPKDKFVQQYGGAFPVGSIPEGLQLLPSGRPGHYVIAPATPMTFERYQQLLNQVRLGNFNVRP